ncbi:hypothetical protein RQP46_005606 [Phenoliferia psychrophenolica]
MLWCLYGFIGLCCTLAIGLGLGLGLTEPPPCVNNYANGKLIGGGCPVTTTSSAPVATATGTSAAAGARMTGRWR